MSGRPFARITRALSAIAGLAVLLLIADSLRPVRTDIRVFDTRRMARLDTDMWRSYYERKPLLLYLQLTRVLREQFHFPLARSWTTAFRAARAAFVFKDGRDRADYERALPDLFDYFGAIRGLSSRPFDVPAAARTELEWWIVHRDRRTHAPGDLAAALDSAAVALYQVPAARYPAYGRERAWAMTLRDDHQQAGGVSEADWDTIDAHLETSWAALRDGLRDSVSEVTPGN